MPTPGIRNLWRTPMATAEFLYVSAPAALLAWVSIQPAYKVALGQVIYAHQVVARAIFSVFACNLALALGVAERHAGSFAKGHGHADLVLLVFRVRGVGLGSAVACRQLGKPEVIRTGNQRVLGADGSLRLLVVAAFCVFCSR